MKTKGFQVKIKVLKETKPSINPPDMKTAYCYKHLRLGEITAIKDWDRIPGVDQGLFVNGRLECGCDVSFSAMKKQVDIWIAKNKKNDSYSYGRGRKYAGSNGLRGTD